MVLFSFASCFQLVTNNSYPTIHILSFLPPIGWEIQLNFQMKNCTLVTFQGYVTLTQNYQYKFCQTIVHEVDERILDNNTTIKTPSSSGERQEEK